MPEVLTKHPNIVLSLLKKMGGLCGVGHEQKILTSCSNDSFCRVKGGEICVIGLSDSDKLTQFSVNSIDMKGGYIGKIGIFIFIFIIFIVAATFISFNKNNKNNIVNKLKDKINGDIGKIVMYEYNNKKVYLVTLKDCFDCFEELYDLNGKYLGAPSGGISGKGDGKMDDFNIKAKFIKNIYINY